MIKRALEPTYAAFRQAEVLIKECEPPPTQKKKPPTHNQSGKDWKALAANAKYEQLSLF
jgi:hypothetical protein